MIRFSFPLLFLFMFLLSTSCTEGGNQKLSEIISPIVKDSSAKKNALADSNAMVWADSVLATLTTEQKIGQMIFPSLYGTLETDTPEEWKRVKSFIKNIHAGGFIFMKSNASVLQRKIADMQEIAEVPLLISSDFERGVPNRSDSGTEFPTNMAIGAANDSLLTYAMGQVVAKESRALGVFLNYAPVSDVNNNPANPIIGTRSFGEDPLLVARLSNALIKGMQDEGILACSKHFPGHGNTAVDSHSDIPVLSATLQELLDLELVPFTANIFSGVRAVMIGHLSLPAVTENNVPASLSKRIITELLRDQLGFDGLVITDALNMAGITKKYTAAQSAVLAVQAGCDILLFPQDEQAAFDALVSAVKKKTVSIERIDESVRRILIAKYQCGLSSSSTAPDSLSVLGTKENKSAALDLARASITLVKNDSEVLPLTAGPNSSVSHIVFTEREKTSEVNSFISLLEERNPVLEHAVVNSKGSDAELAKELVDRSDVIIFSAYFGVKGNPGTLNFTPFQKKLITDALEAKKSVVLLSHGNPYLLMHFPNVTAYVCSYGAVPVSEEALAEALFGEISCKGKLPISIPNTPYKTGFGLTSSLETPLKNQNDFTDVQEYGASGFPPIAGSLFDGVLSFFGIGEPIYNTDEQIPGNRSHLQQNPFEQIDYLIDGGIYDGAYPGGVLLVGFNGSVIYKKAYGRLTYNSDSRRTTTSTIYDLASVTKVIATTTATMLCYDRGLLKLDDPVCQYIPEFGNNGKEQITIRNLLSHNSGLVPYRWFYKDYTTAEEVMEAIYNETLSYETGTAVKYSDLGVIMMGKVIEAVTNMPLDEFCKSEIFDPLGMDMTFYNPPAAWRNNIAPTEQDNYWRNRLLWGEVHDETASLLNGVAGHAGLFSTAEDLAILLQVLLDGGEFGGRQFIQQSTVTLFTTRKSYESTFALGWDTNTKDPPMAGSVFSPLSYGHTGYTGTLVWTDPTRKLFVVFLTNRVYPTRDNNKLKTIRTPLLDQIATVIDRYYLKK